LNEKKRYRKANNVSQIMENIFLINNIYNLSNIYKHENKKLSTVEKEN